MESAIHDGLTVDRRAHIERTLARYPHVDSDQLHDLLRWFREEATALEVGLLASEPELAKPYRQLKSDHLDRFRGADLVWAAVFLTIVCTMLAIIVWPAL